MASFYIELPVSSGGGAGTVTSVGLSAPNVFTVTGSPVTTSGTLALAFGTGFIPVANGGTGVSNVQTSLTTTGTINNYAPATANIYATNTSQTILTGIVAPSPAAAVQYIIYANGSDVVDLSHQGAGSTAANRFDLPNSQTFRIYVGHSAVIKYNTATSRWNVIAASPLNYIAGAGVILAANTPGSVSISIGQDVSVGSNVTFNTVETVVILDSSAAAALNINSRLAFDSFATTRWDWQNGYVYDFSSNMSLDTNTRRAISSDGFTSLFEWDTQPKLPSLTATTVPYIDSSNFLVSSAVTPTELSYLSGVPQSLAPSEYDAGASSTALTIDFNNSYAQKVTMTGNCTFTFSNPRGGAAMVLRLIQDGTGSRTVTWPAAVKWSTTNPVPTLTTTANKWDLINLYYDGTNYSGSYSLGYS